MKRKIVVPVLISIFISIFIGCNESGEFQVLTGKYLGQNPPGDKPRLFAPCIISTGMYERDVAMTPDGDEMYFGLFSGGFVTIFGCRLENGKWTDPEIASFAANPDFNFFEPHITPDGKRMLFLCNMPPEGKEKKTGWFYQNIWAVDRLENGGWSKPYDLGEPINTDDNEYYPSVTSDGTLYFTRSKKGEGKTAIFRSRFEEGKYLKPEKLPPEVNEEGNCYNAFIAPDESYLIACVTGRDDNSAPNAPDYYIFFRDGNDSWSEGRRLGETINSPGGRASSAYVSPDGKFLFFALTKKKTPAELEKEGYTFNILKKMYNEPQNGNSDIYWVSTDILKGLYLKEFK